MIVSASMLVAIVGGIGECSCGETNGVSCLACSECLLLLLCFTLFTVVKRCRHGNSDV